MSEFVSVKHSREMLREYVEITDMDKTDHGRKVVEARKRVIQADVFTEALHKFMKEEAKKGSEK